MSCSSNYTVYLWLFAYGMLCTLHQDLFLLLLHAYKSWLMPYTCWYRHPQAQSFLSQLRSICCAVIVMTTTTRIGKPNLKAAHVQLILSKQAGRFSIIPDGMVLQAIEWNETQNNTQLEYRASWNWHAELWVASSNLTLLIPLITLINTLSL